MWSGLIPTVPQIRTGDEAMVARSPDGPEGALSELLEQFKAYFMCAHVRRPDRHERLRGFPSDTHALLVLLGAQEIQMERAVPGQKVVWLLVSDNEQIRRAAAHRFPDLVLTNLKR